MDVPLVALRIGRVDGEMCRVAFALKPLADEILHQPPVLFERLFVQQGDIEIHCQLRVAALFELLDRVDQLAEVARSIGGVTVSCSRHRAGVASPWCRDQMANSRKNSCRFPPGQDVGAVRPLQN